jgi:hypothetical protein
MNVLLPSSDMNTARIFINTEMNSIISNPTEGSFFETFCSLGRYVQILLEGLTFVQPVVKFPAL